jgi:hypothetical protein
MGVFWSKKVGSDPYYASYERSFEVLKKDIDKIKVQGPLASREDQLHCTT